MHLNSEFLLRKYSLPYFKDGMRILEIGPSGLPSAFQKIIDNSSMIWDTIDFSDSSFIGAAAQDLTYRLSSPYDFPIPEEMYDIVLSGQVIEHVEKIWIWMKELKRVTKTGGHIITINPVSWPYHEAPIDCWRIFPSGIKALADELQMKVDLCLYESIEKENLLKIDPKVKTIPGQSYAYPSSKVAEVNKIIRWNRFLRRMSFSKHLEVPVEVAYDTISVLRK